MSGVTSGTRLIEISWTVASLATLVPARRAVSGGCRRYCSRLICAFAATADQITQSSAMARANSADVLPMGSSSSRRYLSQTRLSATKSLRDRQCGISLLQ
jgi:hypothetical protein